MAKSVRLELGDNIYGYYKSIFNLCDVFSHAAKRQQSNRIRWKKQKKLLRGSRSHSRSSRSVPIESPYVTSYQWLIVTDNLPRTVAELTQLIEILDRLRFWATLWGLRNNVRCSSWAHWKARISDNWTFFATCYGWGATGENRSKIGNFATTRSVWPKISGIEGDAPHQ